MAIIMRKARNDPRKTAVNMSKKLKQEYNEVVVSDKTIRSQIFENLHGRRAVKNALLIKRHRKTRSKVC